MRKSAAGFTLIEMIIAAFIALIIFTVGFTSISTASAVSKDSKARVGSTEDARLFFQLLQHDIAGAVPMTVGGTNYDVTNWQVTFTNVLQVKLAGNYYDTGTNKTKGTALKGGGGAPLVIPSTDALQFFTRIDGRYPNTTSGVVDPLFFVRYYVNSFGHLCREEYVIPPSAMPTLFTTASVATDFDDDTHAVFEYTGAIQFAPMQWDPVTKGLKPLPTPITSASWQQATHVQATLWMYDSAKSVASYSSTNTGHAYQIYPPSKSFVMNIELPYSFAYRAPGVQ